MKRYRIAALVLAFFTISVGGGVLGAAAQDRLSAIFNVGQGAAGTKAMVFDSGNGSSNAQVGSTANTNLTLATNGVTRRTIGTTTETATLPQLGPSGSVTVPSYSFTNDTDSGLYYNTVFSGVGFAADSITQLLVTSSQNLSGNGAVGTPSYSFTADTDTGMYRTGGGSLGLSVNGSLIAAFNSGGISLDGGASLFKARVFTGTLAASASTTLNPGGTIVLGSAGRATLNGNTNDYRQLTQSNTGGLLCTSSTSASICATTGLLDDFTIQNNDTNSTNTYYIVLFYQ